MQPKKTSLGLDEPLEGLLCYAGLWVTGIIFLIIEPDNRFVRFHAIQSLVAFGIINVGLFILAAIPAAGIWLATIGWLGTFALWVAMMYLAFQGHTYKLPFAGNVAQRYCAGK